VNKADTSTHTRARACMRAQIHVPDTSNDTCSRT
jgi:hypothetical protein